MILRFLLWAMLLVAPLRADNFVSIYRGTPQGKADARTDAEVIIDTVSGWGDWQRQNSGYPDALIEYNRILSTNSLIIAYRATPQGKSDPRSDEEVIKQDGPIWTPNIKQRFPDAYPLYQRIKHSRESGITTGVVGGATKLDLSPIDLSTDWAALRAKMNQKSPDEIAREEARDTRQNRAVIVVGALSLGAVGWAASQRKELVALSASLSALAWCLTFPPVEQFVPAKPGAHPILSSGEYARALGHMFVGNMEGTQRIVMAQWGVFLAVCALLIGLSAWWVSRSRPPQ